MCQMEKEQKTFLRFCSRRDRDVLAGREQMKFSDLDRLTYLTYFLDFQYYNMEIWNQYAGQFKPQLEALERLLLENDVSMSEVCYEEEENLQEMWIFDFYKAAPKGKAKQQLGALIKKQYAVYEMELPEQADTP